MLRWGGGGRGTLAGGVRKQNSFVVKLSNLTNMLLDSCFDISLRFPDVEATAIRDVTRDLVDASGGAAGESAAA